MPIPKILVSALLSLALITTHAAAAAWPQLTKGSEYPACKTALDLADAAFKSTAFRLWSATTPVQGVSGKAILGASASINDGQFTFGSAWADEEAFRQIAESEEERLIVYWHQAPGANPRVVIEASVFGSHYAYSAYAVPQDLSESRYLKERSKTEFLRPYAMNAGGWLPPFVFEAKTSRGDRVAVVDVGHPAEFLPKWTVFLPIDGRYAEACEIQFRPDVDDPSALMPRAIARLAELLFKTVGDEPHMFTRKPAIQQAWANAAIRPWADFPSYNSREQVDRRLAEWAEGGAYERKLLARIQAQYPIAEKALARRYEIQFKMPQAQAQAAAQRALDGVLRTHYLFSQDN